MSKGMDLGEMTDWPVKLPPPLKERLKAMVFAE